MTEGVACDGRVKRKGRPSGTHRPFQGTDKKGAWPKDGSGGQVL
jgi:hypothetical protein